MEQVIIPEMMFSSKRSRVYLLLLAIMAFGMQLLSVSHNGWILQDTVALLKDNSHDYWMDTAKSMMQALEQSVVTPLMAAGNDLFSTTAMVATDTMNSNAVQNSNTAPVSKYDAVIAELEAVSLRYYIYMDQNIYMPILRDQLKSEGRGEPGLANIFDALERHSLRTYNASEADFYIVPIMFDSLHAHLHKKLFLGMDALLDSPLFKATQGKRHVYLSIGGRMFSYTAYGSSPLIIRNTAKYREAIQKGIVVKDVDMDSCRQMSFDNNQHGDWKRLFKSWRPISSSTVSVGYMTGRDSPPLLSPTYAKFASSNWTFFYHTRVANSVFNSTIYRHAPLTLFGPNSNISHLLKVGRNINQINNNNESHYDEILKTSSIGFDIPAQEWQARYVNSKFCLVIRGDDPGSRAFLRALRVGCIPVVVSDYFERFSPTLKSFLNISDFAILVPEQDFVNNPGREMRRIMSEYSSSSSSHSRQSVMEKIQGATFAQRVAFPDHPQSLFVPALLKQALMSLPVGLNPPVLSQT